MTQVCLLSSEAAGLANAFQNMITAARLIAHKSINGRYQTLMQMDKMPVLGHQMTHSLDSFITDSANSATALYSGHKTTVNA